MLSIIIPSIRVEKWPDVILSIASACKNFNYEIIFVGPYYNNIIETHHNIKFIRDFGSPNRCQQIGLVMSEGKYVTWGSDDCLYEEDAIDKCIDELINKDLLYLATGYMEGGSTAVSNYSIQSCYKSGKYVDPNWIIFNVAFVRRDILNEFNFDTQFEVTCIAHTDLACRVQKKYPNRGELLNINVLRCEHMPGISGDHKPVHDAQEYSDSTIFFNKYNKEPLYSNEKIDSWMEDDKEVGKIVHLKEIEEIIFCDEWKKRQRIWTRRFSEPETIMESSNIYDLAIVVPSIRPHKIRRLYDSVSASARDLKVKFIVVGNYQPDFECVYLNSLASPNYCVQQAIVELTEDCEYIKWSTDDAVYFPETLLDLMTEIKAVDRSFAVVKYTEEGPPGTPSGKDDVYYTAIIHDDLRYLRGVRNLYKLAPVAIYKRSDFIELGGLNCQYEHINLSTHDLAFRAQENGLVPYISNDVVMHCDSNSSDEEHRPLDIGHSQNDYPIFAKQYENLISTDKIKIDPNNYKNHPNVWRRFQ